MDPGGLPIGHGLLSPGPVKIRHKKMVTDGGRIDFMFLGPPTQPLDPLLKVSHPIQVLF